MERSPPLEHATFFIARVVENVVRTHVSYDKAFKAVARRYGVPRWLRATFYRIGYYAVLYYYTLRWIAARRGYGGGPAGIARAFRDLGFSVRALIEAAEREAEELGVAKALSIKYSYPEHLVKELLRYMRPSEAERLLKSLNERRVWLRVNTARASVAEALECLNEEGIGYRVDDKLGYMVRVTRPKWVMAGSLRCVREGLLIPQDLASAWVAEAARRLLDRGGDVLDACSAPGVKLGLLWSLTGGFWRAIAVDLSRRRIGVMERILGLQGVKGASVARVLGDSSAMAYRGRFRLAIVDAPCSGSGAVPGDPAVKISLWRRGKISHYVGRQLSILSRTLGSAEYIVYSVCSIHPMEGEQVIERIAGEHEAEPVDIGLGLPHGYPGFSVSDKVYRTSPPDMMCQGFFIAVLRAGRR